MERNLRLELGLQIGELRGLSAFRGALGGFRGGLGAWCSEG